VQLTTGIFDFQPPFGVTAWAIGWSDLTNAYQINLMQFEWNSANKTIDQLGATLNVNGYYADAWSIAAGNTIGVLDMQNQNWNLAFYGWQSASGNPVCLTIIGPAANSVPAPTTCGDGINFAYTPGQRLPIVAFDYDGNSLFLGTPVELLAEQVVTTDYIIYEPPKHTFYNIDQSGQWGAYGQIVNVSRYPDFNVTFTQGKATSMNTSSTTTSDWTIGGSASVDGSFSVAEGVDIGLIDDKVKVTTGFSSTIGYSHNQSKQKTDANFSTSSVTYATTTSADDTIGGSIQTLEVWRYRMYGLPPTILKNNPGAFYDYVIPGNIVKMPGNAGMELDWYQPLHENGNLLSYPQATNNTFLPQDIGTINVNGAAFTGPMIPAEQITCCGNGGSTNLSFSGGVSSGSKVTHNNTLNESFDLYQNYSVQADNFGDDVDASAGWSVNFNNTNSWGSAATRNKTTTLNESITLNYSADSTASGYFIYPVMHATPDGTLKVSHAFDLLNSQNAGFWNGYYGQKPDPALNLPYRFYETTYSGNATWLPRLDDTRKTLRGFALLNATPNALTGKNDPYPNATAPSGPVLVQANVYNFSTGGITNNNPTNAKNLAVQFQYAPFNGTQETGPRTLIGTTTLNPLKPLQMLPAQIAWNTNGLGGSTPCSTQQYRIIVTLDPDNTINEIYETENPNTQYPYVVIDPETQQPIPTSPLPQGLFPGQNNEGYGLVTIQTPGSHCAPGFDADVSLRKNSLTAQDAVSKKIRDDNPRLFVNQAARLRLRVFSDKPHGLYTHVLIYDGKPKKGGKLIADKIIHNGNPDGATVWFDWVPTEPGKHILYARLLGRRADPNKKNHREILRVNVIQEVKTRDR
jgi:hypothetical protein